MKIKLNKKRFLDSDIYAVLDELEFLSADLVAVGGCVRDFIVGRDYDDIDIASSTLPDKVMELAQRRGFQVYDTGTEHGTVSIRSMKTGELIEHTTFRKDVSTDGRRATVEFSKSFKTDSTRRDFTINAMGMARNLKIFDFHNGITDLKENLLAFVGKTEERLAEDKLRALRAFRFACRFDLEIQPDDMYLICETFKNDFLDDVSVERVFMEIEKAMKQMTEEQWYRFIRYLSHNVLTEIFDFGVSGHALIKNIAHPLVTETMDFDVFIHMLFWSADEELVNKLPLTSDQKQRIEFTKSVGLMPMEALLWKNRRTLLDTDVLTVSWLQDFLGLNLDRAVKQLECVLDKDWPDNLENEEIGEWQESQFAAVNDVY